MSLIFYIYIHTHTHSLSLSLSLFAVAYCISTKCIKEFLVKERKGIAFEVHWKFESKIEDNLLLNHLLNSVFINVYF